MRSMLAVACLSVAAIAAAPHATAQFFAGKTITIVVNFAAGGDTEIQARIVQKYLPRYLELRLIGGFSSWNYTYARKEILGDPPDVRAIVRDWRCRCSNIR